MQQLSGYGITLDRLDAGLIELVRTWRNQPGVSGNMEVNRYISYEEQLEWFAGLAKTRCYYFVIRVKQTPIGLVHLNRFEPIAHSASVGLFIGEEQYIGTGASLAASLLILEFAFEHLSLEFLDAKVKDANETAIQYNQFLGFAFSKKLNDAFSAYRLTREEFRQKKSGLVKLCSQIVP